MRLYRCFKNIAELLNIKRGRVGMSQRALARALGYTDAQFINCIENARCGLPLKKLRQACQLLDMQPEELKLAILRDMEATIDYYLSQEVDECPGQH